MAPEKVLDTCHLKHRLQRLLKNLLKGSLHVVTLGKRLILRAVDSEPRPQEAICTTLSAVSSACGAATVRERTDETNP
jgi:hypothetical protein